MPRPGQGGRCRNPGSGRALPGLQCGSGARQRVGPKALLWDDYTIRPLIDIRELRRQEKGQADYDPSKPITHPLYPERVDTIVCTEKGGVHRICPASGVQRDLAFRGFEAERDTLKYRCPAAAYGLDCAGREACSRCAGVAPGGSKSQDRRIFTSTPHGSLS